VNGLVIGIEPIILRMGPVVLRWSALLLLVALAAGFWLTLRRAERVGLAPGSLLEAASWGFPLGLLGARLFNLIENWEYYITRPGEAMDMSAAGLNVWGGLAIGGLAIWYFCRRRRLPFLLVGDAAAPALALAEAIGRLGCFFNGAGQGHPSDLPWATLYTSSDALTPDFGVARHPAQVYQGLADLAILGLLWLLRDARLPAGVRYWLWLGLYGLSRALVGMVRLDAPFLLGLQQGQLIGLAAAAISASAIIRIALRRPAPLAVAPR
jgi:phosphatidylglycerol---prolipoprotein diacylglyceryl transferase